MADCVVLPGLVCTSHAICVAATTPHHHLPSPSAGTAGEDVEDSVDTSNSDTERQNSFCGTSAAVASLVTIWLGLATNVSLYSTVGSHV